MITSSPHDRLEAIAEHPAFIAGAYFIAFFPWGMMSNIDFISGKWRTIKRTRQLARWHMWCSTLPMIYVGVYAEAQRRKGDWKECCAAIVALGYNLTHFLRTLVGSTQLNAFETWCTDAIECMRIIQGRDVAGDAKRKRLWGIPEALTFWWKWIRDNSTHSLCTLVGSTQLNAFVAWHRDAIERMQLMLRRDVVGDANRKRLRGVAEALTLWWKWIRDNRTHSLCTLVGSTQLNAFVAEALTFWRKWIRNRNDGDEGSESYNSEAEVEVDILDKLMVNNTIVDNELEGTEVTVNMSWRKVWNGLKKREWKPSSWLETESTSLSTVRWICAFLCALGEDWRVGGPGEHLSAVTRASFYSDDMESPLRILQDVTYHTGASEKEGLTFSVSELLNRSGDSIDLPGTAAYGNDLRDYEWRRCFTSYTLEFDGLRTSYLSRNAGIIATNRENISVELMESVVIAKHIGSEKLRAMRRCFDRLGPRTEKLWWDGWYLLLEQCGAVPSDDSPLWQIFKYLNNIPLFPYRLQMLSLWEECTNWRVLQASAHQDNTYSLQNRLFSLREKSVFEIEPRPACVFEHCRQIGRTNGIEPRFFSGVVLETVRSFLANWLVSSSRIPNWNPVISTASIELPVSRRISGYLPIFRSSNLRLIWECQHGLQMKLARRTNLLEDITAEKEIIMLLLLGLPSMCMEEVLHPRKRDAATINLDGSGGTSDAATFDAEIYDSKFRVWSTLAPQNVCIEIRVDQDASKMCLNLVDNTQDGRFMWQEWINAAMGFMKGADERRASSKTKWRTIRKAVLRIRKLMQTLLTDRESSVLRVRKLLGRLLTDAVKVSGWEIRYAPIWKGWPAFDVRICKFEIDQWLVRCRLDLDKTEIANENIRIGRAIRAAEHVIREIVTKIDDDA